MNENVKAVFEMLGVEPNEEFEVRFPDNSVSLFKYRITKKLDTEWGDEGENCWEKYGCRNYLRKLLVGELIIIKQPGFTDIEQKAIELYKLLGAKYIAKDDNGKTWVYRDKPLKDDSINKWTGNAVSDCQISIKGKLEFNSLSWEDEEPYYIGD